MLVGLRVPRLTEQFVYKALSTGFNGELDQPGEPCVWNGKIIVSCFDLVTDEGKVNTAHEMPATMSMLDLE